MSQTPATVISRDSSEWGRPRPLHCAGSRAAQASSQTGSDDGTTMRMYLQEAITDRIYFLNFHKLTLTNNKDASRESCCVYWIKSANFSSVTWAHQKEQQIYCSAKPGVSQKFRYSFMLRNISYLQISLFCGLLSICSKSLAKELCKMSNNLESSFINLNTFSIIHQYNQIFRATKDYFQRFVHCT